MTTLAIDIETYSSVPINYSVYKYVEASDFEILLFAYAFDDEPVQVVDLTCEELPAKVLEALYSTNVLKTAFNAAFEITCLKKYWPDADYSNWQCTQVMAMYCSLPNSLKDVAKALKPSEKKDETGKRLIQYFSIPCQPTKVNGGRTRNLPKHDVVKWAQFIEYCRQDVVVEREIRRLLLPLSPTSKEWEIWKLDRKINDNGILVDIEMAEAAINLDTTLKDRLLNEATAITGLKNPNSPIQLKEWLESRLGYEIDGVTKKVLSQLLISDIPNDVRRLLEIRQMTCKTSIKKYTAMVNSACADNRCRGMFKFYGASRTARWSGQIVQLQNLPRNYLDNLDVPREAVKMEQYAMLEMCYGDIADVLSQLIRTAFIAPKGSRLIVADFSAIEARIIAWLAGEKWRQDVFATSGKIYEASAAMMFHVPVERIKKGNPEYELRQKGKVAELALGYQGGPPALISMGALQQGLTEEELPEIVSRWREASPKIVQFWRDVENAAKRVIATGERVTLSQGITLRRKHGSLLIDLPSGRSLTYVKAKLIPGKYGDSIQYKGMSQTANEWGKLETYGGKLVENIVQAVARDCLAWAMARLDKAGYKIVAHVHDEVIIEAKKGFGTLDEVISIMCQPEPWNEGLILNAAGFESTYYMKD